MSGYNSRYECNCDASAGAPDHARTCPEHRDYGKISGKDIVDAFDTRGASTVPRERVPAAYLSAYLDKLLPQVAEITHYLSQNGLGTIGENCLPRALELIKQGRAQEAELYAAQDQITGLQELMAGPRVPAGLDTAVRHLVAAAEADDSHQGSPEHGHRIAGRWDGDATHAQGSLCEECAAWDTMRKYVATDNAVPEAPAPATPEPPMSVYTRPVDLLFHYMLLPASAGSPKQAVENLGIQWEKRWGNPVTGEMRLLGCTNVPLDLPKWLEVAK